MWIIPKSLTSVSVLGAEALISGSSEQSEEFARSLLVRSKPLPARTWLRKWSRDSWTQLLSGRMLRRSHGEAFATRYTSSLADIHVNRSAQPASVLAQRIPVTSGPSLQLELIGCDQPCASLKTSKDISAWGCATSCRTWEDWVTERRGAYSRRLKLAPRISESGCSSWPTASTRDWKDTPGMSRVGVLKDGSLKKRLDQLPRVVYLHGQAAQENLNTSGNRLGLLNARWVETLMGLPVGWAMPSCISPVTIEPMS